MAAFWAIFIFIVKISFELCISFLKNIFKFPKINDFPILILPMTHFSAVPTIVEGTYDINCDNELGWLHCEQDRVLCTYIS